MIRGSRVDRIIAAAVLLAAVSLCGEAIAQTETGDEPTATQGPALLVPRPLAPEGAPLPLEPPPPWSPPTGVAAPQIEEPAETPPLVTESIEIGELGAIDPDSGGTLEESMGGLGIEMWAGTDRATLERLLPQLPVAMTSPGMNDLARRLLLSTAVAPAADEGARGPSLVGIRVGKLEAMGLTGAVVDMVRISSSRDTDPELVRATIDSRLAFDDSAGACEAAEPVQEKLSGPYWERIAVFCKIVAGNKEAAAFETKVLAETAGADDKAFFLLAESLTDGRKPKLDSMPRPTLLLLAMARAADAQIPSDALETESPMILRAIADSPNASAGVRLEAAERAATIGAVGPQWLAEKYAAIEFTDDELAKAISSVEGERTARIRALLYQSASLQELPVARAAVIQKAWEIAREDGNYLLMARLYLPLLERIPPSGELVWFAADAARAFHVLGRSGQARSWADLLRYQANDPELGEKAVLLWPVATLARGDSAAGGFGARAHTDWIKSLRRSAGADANRRIGLAYLLMEALGENVPDSNWRALLDGVTRTGAMVPDPAYMRAFRLAAAEGHRGETVLLALILIGPGGLDDAGPDLVAEVLVGLRLVGLEEDARQLAVEAALQGGL